MSALKPHINRLALRMMRRDWRAGELRVLSAALVIAVTCVTSVVFFTDRIAQALDYQASELLAADLRVVSRHPLDAEFKQAARQRDLKTAETVGFRSMALGEHGNQLAEIKAVSEHYPLRGALKISQHPFDAGMVTHAIPGRGEVWVEPRLQNQLSVSPGDTIRLGAKTFTIRAFLRYEPDRGGDMFSIAPRILMNLADLPATGLVQEGSRMRYRLLVAGEQSQVKAYRRWAEKHLHGRQEVEDVSDARQEVRTALDRGRQFLGLSAIVSVLLAFIAVAMAARRYAERHLNTCAILRCVGARQSHIIRIFLVQLSALAFIASALGCILGYLAHLVLYRIAGNLILVSLPAPSLWPVLVGFAVGLLGLMGFALPPVLRLRNVPTMSVIRRELGSLGPVALTSYMFGLLVLAALVLWQAGSLKLGFSVLGGVIATAALLAGFAFLLIILLKRLLPTLHVERRFAVANITRRSVTSVVQVVAFGIGIMVLLLLGIVRGDLLASWQDSLPPDASNRFVINIQPDQLKKVSTFFSDNGLKQAQLYPMVRGRLTKVNGKALDMDSLEGERARHLAAREFNLSWAKNLQIGNKITAGQWWGNVVENRHQFSVEEGIAKTLGLHIGDVLTYQIAGETVSGKITSLRSVQWDTFRANFFVLAPPGLLDNYPASFITSFYLPENKAQLLDQLVNRFPNLTVIDISVIMNQVRGIMSRITLTVEYVFVFTLLAGLTVMYAAIQSTLHQRIRENAILRAIGASRRRLLRGLAVEFVILGLLAGVLAAFCASIAGYVLARQVFDLDFHINPLLWVVGVAGGVIGVGLAGVLGTRKVLARPPLSIIKNF
ncbi:MAG: FtsX-like permease family protein [Gammaproteobacteria bacterium]|jgi:putative ABC transport system permease protein